MTLRWILSILGLMVIAAIYFVGRRNRRASASDDPQILRESHVPQLEHAVRVRERADPPLIVSSRDARMSDTGMADDGEIDDLPPMHADESFPKTNPYSSAPFNSPAHTPISTSYEPIFDEPPTTGMTTGAFIAAQSREPVTRKLSGQPESQESKSFEQNSVTAKPNERSDSVRVAASEQAPTQQAASRPVKKPATRKIVALRLSAGSERVEGARLKSLMEAAGLRHGKYSIYHYLHGDESPLFSVASMVEPGTFDPHAMSGVQFPGVTIFTQLPGPIDGCEMFEKMLTCARELEQGIGGLLQDERGLPLTEQRAQRLREDIADFSHLLGLS